MTKSEAITELVRIWHSPHLDLSLKAGLAEAIDALKGEDGDLISRQAALDAIRKNVSKSDTEDSLCFNLGLGVAEKEVKSLPSAEPRYTGCSGCVHYDQQQTALICHDCKRSYRDMYEDGEA